MVLRRAGAAVTPLQRTRVAGDAISRPQRGAIAPSGYEKGPWE